MAVHWPAGIPALVVTAVLGALLGLELGVCRLAPIHLRQALVVVLVVVGATMMVAA